jgi:hypothetical protein
MAISAVTNVRWARRAASPPVVETAGREYLIAGTTPNSSPVAHDTAIENIHVVTST